MEGSKRKMTKSLIVIAILLHVIASVPHTNANASDTATAGNSASEQFGMLRDGGGLSGSEEQAPSVVIPSSLLNPSSNNNNYQSRTNRLLAVPNSLTRFLFSNSMRLPSPLVDRAMAAQSQTSSSFNGFKRSSSALDSLTGVTLGKRSVGLGLVSPQMELVNYEPLLNRRSALFMRTTPRMYDVGRHWTGSYEFAPFESQASAQLDYNN